MAEEPDRPPTYEELLADNAKLKKRADEDRHAREVAEQKLADVKATEAKAKAVELAAEKERKAQEKEAAQAPDREKLIALAGTLRELFIPDMKTAVGKAALKEIVAEIERLATQAEKALKKR